MTKRLLFSVPLILALILLSLTKVSKEEDQLTMGIIQTASHPALDQAREGFMAEIRSWTEKKVVFIIQNAEGSLTQAHTIAENFHRQQKIKGIFAIGTPAVQAAVKAEKEKPIFITAVSDPASIGILQCKNICGTTDMVDTDRQAELILRLVPTARTIAILYNPGENNSQVMVSRMEQSLVKHGLVPLIFGVHTVSEIPQTIEHATRRGEVILIPNDNLLAGAITLVAKEALKKKCPLVVSDIALVEKGALCAQGAEYSAMGKETAQMANKVLFGGEKPESIGIADPKQAKTVINRTILKILEKNVSQDLLSSSTLVETQE